MVLAEIDLNGQAEKPVGKETLKAQFDEVLGKITPVLDAQQTWPMITQALYHLRVKDVFGFTKETGINFVERNARQAGVLVTEKRTGTRLNPLSTGITSYFLDKNGVKALALICVLVGYDLTSLSQKNREYWKQIALTIHQTLDPEDPLCEYIHIPQDNPPQNK